MKTTSEAFLQYASTCKDERGESALFLNRLFRELGWEGLTEAGASLETRVKRHAGGTGFADMTWKDRSVIWEQKKGGEDLLKHFNQARGYWLDTRGWRARWIVMSNFQQFLLYDMSHDTYDPVASFGLDEVHTHFWFMAPEVVEERIAVSNRTVVSRQAASSMSRLLRTLLEQGETPENARKVVLRSVLCMVSEDIGLLPENVFTSLLQSSDDSDVLYDLIQGLWRQMDSPHPARAGKYVGVPYFNGGLFKGDVHIQMNPELWKILLDSAELDWKHVNPSILGTIFQNSMTAEDRHTKGAHYTDERDILRVVLPTIIAPYREIYQRIKERPKNTLTHDMEDLGELIGFLEQEVVLDPACGSGNFLFVAYREIVQLHGEMMRTWDIWSAREGGVERRFEGRIDIKNFKGIDIDEFAVELAKLTMTLASELWSSGDGNVLPLSNLDGTIVKADSLMAEWPKASRIVGNPPFLGWERASAILGKDYTHGLKKHFGISGSPDLCSLFFMKAASEQPVSAGLVATSAIKNQPATREVALGSVLKAGRIVDAVAQIPWQGDAEVHVSIVNWVSDATEHLPISRYESALPVIFPVNTNEPVLEEDGKVTRMARIPETLSVAVNVTSARKIPGNPVFRRGREPGHKGFRFDLKGEHAHLLDHRVHPHMVPHLTGSSLMTATEEAYDKEYLLDMQPEVQRYSESMARNVALEEVATDYGLAEVFAPIKADFDAGVTKKLAHWSVTSENTPGMGGTYLGRARVSSSGLVETLSGTDPNDTIYYFERHGDFYYGIFNSSLHWAWACAQGSRLKSDVKYTSSYIDTTFPWTIEDPTIAQTVIDAARNLQTIRKMHQQRGMSLREMARALRTPGTLTLLEDAKKRLDDAVLVAYGLPTDASEDDILSHLYALNQSIEGPVFPHNADEYAGHVWLRGVPVEDLKKSKEEEANGE